MFPFLVSSYSVMRVHVHSIIYIELSSIEKLFTDLFSFFILALIVHDVFGGGGRTSGGVSRASNSGTRELDVVLPFLLLISIGLLFAILLITILPSIIRQLGERHRNKYKYLQALFTL